MHECPAKKNQINSDLSHFYCFLLYISLDYHMFFIEYCRVPEMDNRENGLIPLQPRYCNGLRTSRSIHSMNHLQATVYIC